MSWWLQQRITSCSNALWWSVVPSHNQSRLPALVKNQCKKELPSVAHYLKDSVKRAHEHYPSSLDYEVRQARPTGQQAPSSFVIAHHLCISLSHDVVDASLMPVNFWVILKQETTCTQSCAWSWWPMWYMSPSHCFSPEKSSPMQATSWAMYRAMAARWVHARSNNSKSAVQLCKVTFVCLNVLY